MADPIPKLDSGPLDALPDIFRTDHRLTVSLDEGGSLRVSRSEVGAFLPIGWILLGTIPSGEVFFRVRDNLFVGSDGRVLNLIPGCSSHCWGLIGGFVFSWEKCSVCGCKRSTMGYAPLDD